MPVPPAALPGPTASLSDLNLDVTRSDGQAYHARTWLGFRDARRFDDLCAQFGRDPAAIRHSVVCFPPLTPWESIGYFTDMVGRLREAGIDGFVLYWPQTWREQPREEAVFEEVTRKITIRVAVPAARSGSGT